MGDAQVCTGNRPHFERVVVTRRQWETEKMRIIVSTENVSRPTDWCFEEAHHTVVVHLDGRLHRMESVFAKGPSSDTLPSIGDVWTIPAGQRYAALAHGDYAHFAEFHLPSDAFDDSQLDPRVAHRDSFLHEAAVKVASLSRRQDDLAQMALRSLLQVIRFHFQDVYLKGSKTDRSDDNGATRAFSEREKRLLVEFLASSLHESLNIQRLADLLGITVQQLIQGFKASFGTTPWQHVLRMRLAEGLRLLQHSDITVAQIAVATGFFSSSHFATACTKHFGISPSGYRRLSRGLARR